MTKKELQELAALTASGKTPAMKVLSDMTPEEYSLYRFYQSRNDDWAKPYGGTVPHYPSERHIEKNLAPEKNITRMSLETLAQANQIARKNDLMSPKLADNMLPTMLVEGAPGINGWGYPDTPKYRGILTKAGLPPTIAELNKLPNDTEYDRSLTQAKMMHALMAAKAAQYGDDLALERWNGKGANNVRGADASNHYRKVLETAALLKHPKNKEMLGTWDELSQRYAGENPQEMRQAPEQPLSWEQENLPTAFSNAVGAVRKAIPDISLKNVQDTVRNWTAPTTPVVNSNKKGGAVKLPTNYSNGNHKLI